MRQSMLKKGLILLILVVIVIVPVSGAVVVTKNDIQVQTYDDLSYNLYEGGYTNITVWNVWNMTQDTSDGNQIPIDVRRNDEWIPEHIDTPFPEDAKHWPDLQNGDNLTKFMDEFRGKQVIIYCRTGVRSFNAVKLLIDRGFTGTIYNMIGGITEWKKQLLPVKPNEAPTKPTIFGPSNGKVGIPLEYTFTTSDTDYDDISYCIKWDNASKEECVGPFSVSEQGSATHTYIQEGSYTIRVTAKDPYNFVSEEATLLIPMPKYQLLEKNEKTNKANITGFFSFFGFMIADAGITETKSHPGGSYYLCTPVEKVTVIGFGFYYTENDTEFNTRFYIKSFTNVGELLFISSEKLDVSNESQHISLFVTHQTPCLLLFN